MSPIASRIEIRGPEKVIRFAGGVEAGRATLSREIRTLPRNLLLQVVDAAVIGHDPRSTAHALTHPAMPRTLKKVLFIGGKDHFSVASQLGSIDPDALASIINDLPPDISRTYFGPLGVNLEATIASSRKTPVGKLTHLLLHFVTDDGSEYVAQLFSNRHMDRDKGVQVLLADGMFINNRSLGDPAIDVLRLMYPAAAGGYITRIRPDITGQMIDRYFLKHGFASAPYFMAAIRKSSYTLVQIADSLKQIDDASIPNVIQDLHLDLRSRNTDIWSIARAIRSANGKTVSRWA